jgi:hypothetical protein
MFFVYYYALPFQIRIILASGFNLLLEPKQKIHDALLKKEKTFRSEENLTSLSALKSTSPANDQGSQMV